MNSARHYMSARKQRRLMRPWWSLWSSWCVVALCALICGGAALAASFLRDQPLYRASATVAVTSASAQNSALKTTLVSSYAQLAIARPVLAAVASRYPGVSVDALAQEVSVSTSASAGTFQIIVLDPDATHASLLASQVADEASSQALRAVQKQYSVEEQQLRQDLQRTNAQIARDTSTLKATSPAPDSQHRALIQTQLEYLRQRSAGDELALSQLEAALSTTSSPLRVETAGQAQAIRSKPSFTVSVIAALCGIGIGVLLELAVASRRQRIRGSHDVEVLLGAPVLAVLPATASRFDEGFSFPSLSGGSGQALPRSLFITSVRSSSQARMAILSLALSLAGAGRKVLLVDADLRGAILPDSVSWLDGPIEPGLSDIVLATARRTTTRPISLPDTLRAVSLPDSAARAVRVLPRGTPAPNPLGVLRSSAMGAVYQQLLSYGADVVIFMGPPLLDSAEAPFLAGQLDAGVLMVDTRRLRRADLLAAAELLRASQTRVLGCIVVGSGPHP